MPPAAPSLPALHTRPACRRHNTSPPCSGTQHMPSLWLYTLPPALELQLRLPKAIHFGPAPPTTAHASPQGCKACCKHNQLCWPIKRSFRPQPHTYHSPVDLAHGNYPHSSQPKAVYQLLAGLPQAIPSFAWLTQIFEVAKNG